MDITETLKEGRTVLVLSGELTIFCVTEIKDTLLKYVRDYRYLELDCSDVTVIDTAGLQLLMLMKKDAFKKKHTLLFAAHSEAIESIAALLHMHVFFDLGEIPR